MIAEIVKQHASSPAARCMAMDFAKAFETKSTTVFFSENVKLSASKDKPSNGSKHSSITENNML